MSFHYHVNGLDWWMVIEKIFRSLVDGRLEHGLSGHSVALEARYSRFRV
jgi:hypothetical protein